MDPDTIQKIAAELAKHLSGYWWVLGVQALVMAGAGAFGAYFGEFFRTRGKIAATKADFDTLQAQLLANTQLAESVKADIGQKDWAKCEWTNIRRIKLEALFDKLHDSVAYLNAYYSKATDGLAFNDHDPMNEMDTIATMYFPELKSEFLEFRRARHAVKGIAIELCDKILQAGPDMNARQNAFDR
jgi:hypothetical protein